jgi:hypothetical protein
MIGPDGAGQRGLNPALWGHLSYLRERAKVENPSRSWAETRSFVPRISSRRWATNSGDAESGQKWPSTSIRTFGPSATQTVMVLEGNPRPPVQYAGVAASSITRSLELGRLAVTYVLPDLESALARKAGCKIS